MGSSEGRGLLEAVLAAAEDGIAAVGADGSVLFANAALRSLCGLPAGVGDPLTIDDIEAALEPSSLSEVIRGADASDAGVIGIVRSADGRVFEVSSRPLGLQGMPGARVLNFDDVTDRSKVEDELRSAEMRSATLLRHVPAALYEDIVDETSPAGVRPVYISHQIEDITGYPASAFMEDLELWENIVHPEDRLRVKEENRAFYRNPGAIGQVCRIVAADGRIVWVHDWAHVADDPVTGERHLFGVVQDISHLRQAEERAMEAEARWRAILEEIPGVVYRYDAMAGSGEKRLGAAPWVSPAVIDLLGHTQEEWMADPDLWVDMLHPDDREWVLKESERTDRTGEPFDAEYRFLLRDGTIRWVHDRAVVVGKDADGRPRWWQGLIVDVTERRAIHQRILEVQEEERAAIARQIEDSSLQAMTAAGLRASVALTRAGVIDDPAWAAVQLAIEEAVSSLRHLLFELRPPALDRGGLSEAVGEYLRLLASRAGGELRLDDRLQEQPGEPLRTVAYRVIQAVGKATIGRGLGTAVRLGSADRGLWLTAVLATAGADEADREIGVARELARSVGGWLEIEPDGSRIGVWLPVGQRDRFRA